MKQIKPNLNKSASDLQIQVIQASFAYNQEDVLSNISLDIRPGEFLGIIGPNGSGKSTLLKLISGVLKADSGKINFQSTDLRNLKRGEIARSISWIPQENFLAFPFKVQEVVLMGRHPYLSPLTFEGERDFRIAKEAMNMTDTLIFANRLFNEISGGEKQRVMIASAISQESDVMALDEPTSALDIKYQIDILNILKRLNKERKITLILAMHDLHLASKFCQRLVLLDGGKIAADGPPKEVLDKNILEQVYGIRVKVFKDPEDGSVMVSPG